MGVYGTGFCGRLEKAGVVGIIGTMRTINKCTTQFASLRRTGGGSGSPEQEELFKKAIQNKAMETMNPVAQRALDDAKAKGIWPTDQPGFSAIFFGPSKMKCAIGLAHFRRNYEECQGRWDCA